MMKASLSGISRGQYAMKQWVIFTRRKPFDVEAAPYNMITSSHIWLFKFKLNVKFIFSVYWHHFMCSVSTMSGGDFIGQCSYRTFLSSQKVLSDSTVLRDVITRWIESFLFALFFRPSLWKKTTMLYICLLNP